MSIVMVVNKRPSLLSTPASHHGCRLAHSLSCASKPALGHTPGRLRETPEIFFLFSKWVFFLKLWFYVVHLVDGSTSGCWFRVSKAENEKKKETHRIAAVSEWSINLRLRGRDQTISRFQEYWAKLGSTIQFRKMTFQYLSCTKRRASSNPSICQYNNHKFLLTRWKESSSSIKQCRKEKNGDAD